MGFVSLRIGDDTARFRRTIILHEIKAPSPPRARLSSPPPPWALSPSRSVTALSDFVAPSSSEIEAFEHRLHQIERDLIGYETLNPAKPGLPPELKLVLTRHPRPLGHDSRSIITTMVSFVAHSYARPAVVALLSTFMSYYHATSCPTADPLLLSKLISKACEPLPRRCRPPPPPSLISLEPQCQDPLPGRPRPLWAMLG